MKNIYLVNLNIDKSKFAYISNTLINFIKKALDNNKKTILYINKRWMYDLLICADCNHLKKCPKCDIALSIHKNPEMLICHHCSYTEKISLNCEKCFWSNLKKIWIWTEQVEESILKIFPKVKIFRLDSDNIKNSTLKKEALENINNSEIIIWTKMITTWFDFKNIWVIWIILIEQELQIPKYDTEEKIFQNIKQLIWRWWRSWEETDIIIQTFIPNNNIIKNIIDLNYKDFLKETLLERKLFNYPPFCELITIRYKDKNEKKSIDYINYLKEKLDSLNSWGFEIIKVENIIKRDNQYFSYIIIKWHNIRDFLQNIKKEILTNKNLVLIFD